MDDFGNLEKTIVRELSCRLCLCTDVVKLKPMSSEIKRKIKRLFEIVIRTDDNLPKAICHDCLHQISVLYLYSVKVDKTQKFLDFYKKKCADEKMESIENVQKLHPIIATLSVQNVKKESNLKPHNLSIEFQQGDQALTAPKSRSPTRPYKKKSPLEMKFLEAMTMEEFANSEKVDKNLLAASVSPLKHLPVPEPKPKPTIAEPRPDNDTLDPIVLIEGRPAKQGAALDKQITLFYKMECCICHEKGFHFRSLMRHYKDRHGVPGYVTCCDKKFHYFYPKKIIEHMAYHLQPNIFMCSSCHQNFQTSQELTEHQSNGGRSEGKILCPRCSEKFPTYRELGWHIVSHRTDKCSCDYCGKTLKHHHRKKTVNHMEDVILCSQCVRNLKHIEKQEKDIKEKVRAKSNEATTQQKHHKFKQAMGMSGDEDGSTD